MKKTGKITLIVIVMLLFVTLTYYAYKKAVGEPITNPLSKFNGKGFNKANDFPLKKGSRGDKVKYLQEYLNYSGDYKLLVDGIFGDKTEDAVITELSPAGGKIKEVSENYYNQFIVPFINYAVTGYKSGGYHVEGTDAVG